MVVYQLVGAVMEQPPSKLESPVSEEPLAQSRSASSTSSYSTNSFESITDDASVKYERDLFQSSTHESSRNYGSDSFESITDESSRNYESDSFESLSFQRDLHQTSLSETVNSLSEAVKCEWNDPEKGLLEKWIKILVEGKTNSSRRLFETVAHEEPAVNNALQSYCSIKIQQMCQPAKARKQGRRHPATSPRGSTGVHPLCHVPHELMNRLQLQNIKETMKQAMQIEMHEPASCPDCRNRQAELALYQFVRMRKTKLETDLLDKKIEEYTYSQNLVTCIGEIHQSLPKPSDESSTIWQRLYTSVKKT
ncbi:uncharacterized protein C8orf48 homolog [Mixophyes fleayi]|uniref:uncharacterized protein C8orf48 homolog n=1 Tax=Mixophyes fleayi TaxID=3061075 RepID=UPI003F4DD9E8